MRTSKHKETVQNYKVEKKHKNQSICPIDNSQGNGLVHSGGKILWEVYIYEMLWPISVIVAAYS